MMVTIFTLIVLGMVFQGIMIVVDSILDTAKINPVLKAIPIIGTNLNLIWAYAFVAISAINGGGWLHGLGYGSTLEFLSLGRFGTDIATALAIVAFVPIRNAAISFLRNGVMGMAGMKSGTSDMSDDMSMPRDN